MFRGMVDELANRTGKETRERIVALRRELTAGGLDAGPESIACVCQVGVCVLCSVFPHCGKTLPNLSNKH
ncbi:hypothetical protein BW13_07700 [Bifidobacterium sp. UTCIF-37]|nr:hypothetical protein BW13_07700 [Bifidobacterium sp. UTCIF-37]TPF88188.1 hypothetical protein BW11_08085 [Bifidobacterium sp. UTCIF-38]